MTRVFLAFVALAFLGLAVPAFAQAPPQAAPTGQQQRDVAAFARRPRCRADHAGGREANRRQRLARRGRLFHRLAVRTRGFDREGGVRAAGAGVDLVVGDHHQQMACAGDAAPPRGEIREDVLVRASPLDELYQQFAQKTDNPMTAVFTAALREWRRAFEAGNPREAMLPGVKDRIEKAMSVTILRRRPRGSRSIWASSPRSAPRRRSSACSARCGAS